MNASLIKTVIIVVLIGVSSFLMYRCERKIREMKKRMTKIVGMEFAKMIGDVKKEPEMMEDSEKANEAVKDKVKEIAEGEGLDEDDTEECVKKVEEMCSESWEDWGFDGEDICKRELKGSSCGIYGVDGSEWGITPEFYTNRWYKKKPRMMQRKVYKE